MLAFLNADLRPGVDIVLDTVGIDTTLEGADLVLVGEGEVDFQTVYNKAPIGVAKRAKRFDIPSGGYHRRPWKGLRDGPRTRYRRGSCDSIRAHEPR